jgi:Glycosyl transferase family 90
MRRRQRGGATSPPEMVSREQFNSEFPEANLVILPKWVIAFGVSNSNLYVYNFHDHFGYPELLLNFLRTEIVPRVQTPKWYVVVSIGDGYSERLPLPIQPITYYTAAVDQFAGKNEIVEPDPHRYPFLHSKKYVLCFSKRKPDIYSIPIPDPYFLGPTLQNTLNDITQHRIPWEQKVGRCIWKGNPDNGNASEHCDGCAHNVRHEYVKRVKDGRLPLADYIDRKMSKGEQMKWKYILDINGWTNTWDATPWKMASGSLMLKVDGIWEQWYYPQMKDGVHYILVKRDLSDLNEKIQWCIDHDDECKKIVANAKQFVDTVITMPAAIQHTVQAIQVAL